LTGGSDASGPVLTKAPLSSLSLLWTRARRYPWHIVGALVALTTSATTMLTVPWSFKQVIDRGFAAGVDSDAVSSSFHLLLGLVGVLAIATSVRFFLVSWVAERVVADIRNEVQDNLLEMSPPFFEDNRPAEIASRLTADTTVIEQVVGSMLSIALRNLFTLVGGVGFMFFYSAKLATMLMIGIPLVLSPILLLSRRLRRLSQESQSYVAEVGSVATEVLSAMKVVKAFGQEKRESGRIHATVEAVFTAAKRRIGIRALMTASVIGLITGAITLILWQGAVDVAEGRMTGGAIAGFVLTAGIVASSFNTLAEVYGDVLRGAGAAMRLNELLAVRPTITAPADPVPLPRPGVGRLVFDRVRFHYPTRPDTPAIADLTLTIEPGETVAVIGPSGAGKSTLFQLAQRFYDPQSGTVSLDGVNLRDADPADVRERISIVPQETILFAASARDNLRYGRWDASDEAIWAAADAANATGFLKAMPDQLDTFLGESGARLSGGQRQRIAIARALLRDPPLLLLDEATSALDSESETLVRRALERLMRGRTTVVIAHRLSTIQNADRIVVMDAGRIIEEGRHDSLQAADGLYARMARLQFEAAA
jgi:ATP-binding cassette subfamily B protein